MALLEILRFPDPRLRIKAKPVEKIDNDIRKIVADMIETMYHSRGVGLAATQVGIDKRIFVMDVSENHEKAFCVINPEILSQSGLQDDLEGCLSVGANAYERVKRASNVHLRAKDIDGNVFELEATELMAACIQHEIDHLNGILFIDHLSRLKQDRLRKKIEKYYSKKS